VRLYLDTSVALHVLLPWGDPRASEWLAGTDGVDALYSSTLLQLEIMRVLRREQMALDLAGDVLDRVSLVSIDDQLLRSAGAIKPHVRSLDAIHMATCGLLGEEMTLVTHDTGLRKAAHELGRATLDPLTAD